MKIFIGSDHGGFKMKEETKQWLIDEGYDVEDCGNLEMNPDDDYPDFAFPVAEHVAAMADSRGIMFCRSGGGVVISANKVNGIRAVDIFDMTSAVHARTHNDANVMSIGADWTDPREARLIIKTFLETEFKSEERHVRRIQKIAQYEQQRR